MPPYLFYALKAKTMASLGVADESIIGDKKLIDVRQSILMDIREIAKSVMRDVRRQGLDVENHLSAAIQNRLMHTLLGENEPDGALILAAQKAIPINASRSGKNVTIPPYLFHRLSRLFGGDSLAKLQIHEMMVTIRRQLDDAGMINDKGELTGDAQHSSWSRKLHNHIFLELIKVSNLRELHLPVSMMDVKMLRDPRLETKVRSGKLKPA